MTASSRTLDILVVGATGSVGRHVVDEALAPGHRVRILARDPARARQLSEAAHRIIGDLTRPASLAGAVAGVDAIVFTHGSDARSRKVVVELDYGVVSRRQIARVLLASLDSPTADRKTFELVAESGPEPSSFDALFARLDVDPEERIDGVRDPDNMPLASERENVVDDLAHLARRT